MIPSSRCFWKLALKKINLIFKEKINEKMDL